MKLKHKGRWGWGIHYGLNAWGIYDLKGGAISHCFWGDMLKPTGRPVMTMGFGPFARTGKGQVFWSIPANKQ